MKYKEKPTQGALAVATASLWQYPSTTARGATYYKGGAEVMWYRREAGRLTVYIGEATCYQPQEASSVTEWLEGCAAPVDLRRRYSYNGSAFRPRSIYEEAAPLRELHASLSEGRLDLPDGWQGWWKPRHVEPPGGFGHYSQRGDAGFALCGANPLMTSIHVGEDGTPVPRKVCPVCVSRHAALQDA